jgi:glycosyltransferase involved in cell wall biosynthesis
MPEPQVSVIIPTYNRAGILRRAVGSVFGQTFDNFELIIVNDGSTDNTLNLLAGIKDSRLRVIDHDTNRGAAAARNTGIGTARGTYVAFLDSDDEWLPDKLIKQVDLLDKAPPDIGACCARHFVTLDPQGESWRRMLPTDYDWRRRLLEYGCDLSPGSTLMARRDIFEKIGNFDLELPRYEDWDWLLRYLGRYRLGISEETLAVVHLSSPPSAAVLEKAVDIFLSRWLGEARKVSWVAARRLKARLLIELAKSLLLENRFRAGIVKLVAGLMQWPLQRPGSALALIYYLRGSYRTRFSVKV